MTVALGLPEVGTLTSLFPELKVRVGSHVHTHTPHTPYLHHTHMHTHLAVMHTHTHTPHTHTHLAVMHTHTHTHTTHTHTFGSHAHTHTHTTHTHTHTHYTCHIHTLLMQLHIMKYLDVHSLVAMTMTCRELYILGQDSFLWRGIFTRDFGQGR